jgi:hypothetical protein
LLSAVASNVLRIIVLAIGLAYPPVLGGINVMAAPWHDLIGTVALMLGALPVILWGIRTPTDHPRPTLAQPSATGSWTGYSRQSTVFAGLGFVLTALVIVSLPAHPVDVARQIQPPRLPSYLVGFPGIPAELSILEEQYFTRYGGGAARASYGPYSLLTVRTSAPLRHLHAPDECLTGAGHRVQYLGLSYQPIPTAIYRSEAPDGRQWLITVTFISNSGELATSVAEAVWRWLKNPVGDWTMVQRIAPWKTPATALRNWELAVARALDLPPSEPLQLVSQTRALHDNN